MTQTVKCPHCKKPAVFSPENPFRPFCSERCSIMDLGSWASGDYAIPAQDHEYIEVVGEEAESDEES